jgi:ribosomal protein S18 acetylase RimI-like enzyme
MTRVIRATLNDVEGIAAVVHDVWAQGILPKVARAQIEDDACALWVAREEDDVLGFISAFLTRSRTGERRWEVDLLAVEPASRGQGLGQRLIRGVCQDGEEQGATLARAAIRVDNVPSQAAFRKAGFSTDGRLHHLLLWEPEDGILPPPDLGRVSLTSVDTLTYRGVWIEGLQRVSPSVQRAAVRAARGMAARQGRLKTGALIPVEGQGELATDLRAEAKCQGRYHCFIKPSSKTRGR